MRKLPMMNRSTDFLAGLEIIKETAQEAKWSDEQLKQTITSFAQDWQDRRHSDLLKRQVKNEV